MTAEQILEALDDAHAALHAALKTPQAEAERLRDASPTGPTHLLGTWLARLHEALHRVRGEDVPFTPKTTDTDEGTP